MKFNLAAAFLILAGCSVPAGQETKVEYRTLDRRENMIEVSIGRFRIAIPEQTRVASRHQSIYGVDIRTAPFDDVPIATQWRNLRAQFGPDAREIKFPDDAIGLFYAPYSAMPMNLVLEAMRPMGSHALWVSCAVTAGKESSAERLVAKILSVYGPGTRHGFCAELGSIRMEGSLSESTTLSLVHKQTPGVKIDMETQTVMTPDTSTFTSLDEERDLAKAYGGTLDVRSERYRTVAGMTGKEFRLALTLAGKTPKLRYTWQFSGEPRNPARPHINIVGIAESPSQSNLEAAWEALLDSLTPIPMEASR